MKVSTELQLQTQMSTDKDLGIPNEAPLVESEGGAVVSELIDDRTRGLSLSKEEDRESDSVFPPEDVASERAYRLMHSSGMFLVIEFLSLAMFDFRSSRERK
ncbi:hypothetical protein Dimus_021012 [Dionaea muscipula]